MFSPFQLSPFRRRPIAGGGGGGGAFTFLDSVGVGPDTSNVTVTTGAIDTSGADLLVAALSFYTPGVTISDNKGNSWTPLTPEATFTNGTQLAYCRPTSKGGGHTFTANRASGDFPSVYVLAFSGSNASPFDSESGATATGSPSGVQPGSLTPTVNNSLLISAFGAIFGYASAIDSGFTAQQAVAFIGSVAIAYKIQTTASAENPFWTFNAGGTGGPAGDKCSSTLAVFKPA